MVDAEVLRLRKLRNVALRTRVLGKILDSHVASNDSVFARASVLCWTIARIATGRLRAHPYLNYQKGRGQFAELADSFVAAAVATAARRRNRTAEVFAEHLQAVAREVDDVRSVSWSPELSDALGRMQIHARQILSELDSALPAPRFAVPAVARRPIEDLVVEDNWPYLAI